MIRLTLLVILVRLGSILCVISVAPGPPSVPPPSPPTGPGATASSSSQAQSNVTVVIDRSLFDQARGRGGTTTLPPPPSGAPISQENPSDFKVSEFEAETDRPGNDIQGGTFPSCALPCCQAKCLASAACGAFTVRLNDSTCFLKRASTCPVHLEGHTSAVILSRGLTFHDGMATDLTGNDYAFCRSLLGSMYQECAHTCLGDEICRAWVFYEEADGSSYSCALKTDRGEDRRCPTATCQSGYKVDRAAGSPSPVTVPTTTPGAHAKASAAPSGPGAHGKG